MSDELDWLWVLGSALALALAVYYWASRSPKESASPAPAPPAPPKPEPSSPLPVLSTDEDDDLDVTRFDHELQAYVSPPTMPIVYDDDAAIDEPTQNRAFFVVRAAGQTDKGLRRKKNEDRLLVLEEEGIFAVADGMGGYRGGELASDLAVSTLARAFRTGTFEGAPHEALPRRASELARAIQMANREIYACAARDRALTGMGTTISVARFSPNKQRLYIAHVGDSRVYRYRDGILRQMTADHTMQQYGVAGEGAGHLSRALGISPTVPIDIVFGKPRPGDIYLLCSDGLTKMVPDEDIEATLKSNQPEVAVEKLIAAANDHGGKDNISVVVVRVAHPVAAAA